MVRIEAVAIVAVDRSLRVLASFGLSPDSPVDCSVDSLRALLAGLPAELVVRSLELLVRSAE